MQNNKRLTTEEFIRRAHSIHGDKYDYSKTVYVNAKTKVCIICKQCGEEFFQTPINHLGGKGCKKCAREYVASIRRLTKEKFIERANKVWGEGFYGYDKVVYVNSETKVEIWCPEHGYFYQTPNNFLDGHGCTLCSGLERWSKKRLIKEGRKKFGSKFDYSNAKVKNQRDEVEIKCNECGTVFLQSPKNHIQSLQGGCPTCRYRYSSENRKVSFSEFERRSKIAHNNKYIYDRDSYTDIRHNVNVFCPEHGWFSQNATLHSLGCGCPECGNKEIANKLRHTNEWFIEKSKEIHGDRYDYSLCDYKALDEKVTIICKRHGAFEQTPAAHLRGYGCPVCKSTIGEQKIDVFLSKHNITFVREFRIARENSKRKTEGVFVDFFLPEKNTIIEFNGKQHYVPVERWGGEKHFKKQQERDEWLRHYCKENGIKLIEIHYSHINKTEEILRTELNINNIKT